MFGGLRLFGWNEVDRWRDEHLLVAAAALNYLAVDLLERSEVKIAEASWQDLTVTPGRFVRRQVAPHVRAAAEPVVRKVVDQANTALAKLVDHRIAWQMQAEAAEESEEPDPGIFAVATAPLVSSTAWAGALPRLALRAITTGAIGTKGIKTTAQSQMRDRVRDHIGTVLLTGTEKRPSVLDQLRVAYTDAAERAKGA